MMSYNSNKYEFVEKGFHKGLNMPTPNDPIDIEKSQIEILMDQINVLNNVNLNHNDFIFSLPSTASFALSDINTKVTITPKITSGFFNSRDIYYKRIDVAQLFNNDLIEIVVTTETLLSEIIDQVNDKYGINITAADYVDVPLPVPDPLIPNPTVTVAIKPESYIYVGTGGLILGERIRPVDDSGFIRNIALITDSDEGAGYVNEVMLLNTNYEPAGYFDLLRNTVSVDTFEATKLLALPNGKFYVGGNFEFDAAIGAGTLQTHIATGLIIDNNGLVEQVSATPLFGAGVSSRYGINKSINAVYLADIDNLVTPTNPQKLYKFNLDGTRDNTFNPTGISYTPVLVRVADDGKIYTVSDQFSAPLVSDPLITAKQIRIDRLNSNGTADNTFSTIYIRSTGIVDVTPIVDLLPITGGGGFICLKPIHGLAVTGNYPIVNDIPFVTGSEPTDSAFNPVFRFNQSGGLVTTFKNVLLNNNASTVMIDHASIKENDSVLSFADNKLIVLTNRINPLTGHTHRAPVCFNTSGNIINIAPDRLASDVRWTNVVSFNKFSNGKFIIVGQGTRRLANGGWSTAEYMVAVYNQSGQLVNIGFKPVIVGVPIPGIFGCAVTESLI